MPWMQEIADINKMDAGARNVALVIKNIYGRTPLHATAQYLSNEAFIAFIQKFSKEALSKALVMQNNDSNTPLHIAAKRLSNDDFMAFANMVNSDNLSEALVIQNNDGNTPLHIAVDNNKSGVVLALIEKTDINTLSRAYFVKTIELALEAIKSLPSNTENRNKRLRKLKDCVALRLNGRSVSRMRFYSTDSKTFVVSLNYLMYTIQSELPQNTELDPDQKTTSDGNVELVAVLNGRKGG